MLALARQVKGPACLPGLTSLETLGFYFYTNPIGGCKVILIVADSYLRLFCMAMDLLSIPSMSSENERAFSQAKLVVTSQRHRLHYTTLNKLVCLKAWNKDGTFLEGWGN